LSTSTSTKYCISALPTTRLMMISRYVFEVLLEAGATLSVDDDGWTPLHAAAASATADYGVIRLLVDAVVRRGKAGDCLLDAKTNDGQNTALHLAAANEKALSPARCATFDEIRLRIQSKNAYEIAQQLFYSQL